MPATLGLAAIRNAEQPELAEEDLQLVLDLRRQVIGLVEAREGRLALVGGD